MDDATAEWNDLYLFMQHLQSELLKSYNPDDPDDSQRIFKSRMISACAAWIDAFESTLKEIYKDYDVDN